MKWRKWTLITKLTIFSVILTTNLTGPHSSAQASTDAGNLGSPCNHNTTDYNILHAVSAVSSSNIWTVGGWQDGFGVKPLIENWDGSNWTEVTGVPTNDDSELFGIFALDASHVWTVGYNTGSGIAERFRSRRNPPRLELPLLKSVPVAGRKYKRKSRFWI